MTGDFCSEQKVRISGVSMRSQNKVVVCWAIKKHRKSHTSGEHFIHTKVAMWYFTDVTTFVWDVPKATLQYLLELPMDCCHWSTERFLLPL